MSSNDSLLDEKYKNIRKTICDMMLYPRKEMRPTCDQVLSNKNLWSLDISDIENNEICRELRGISINELSIEQGFCKYFIKTKF
jgi:hypothetical protein